MTLSIKLCIHGVNEKFCVKCASAPRKLSALSDDQKEAVDKILGNQGCIFFLTGPAGCGKTFVVNHLRHSVPGCSVCAMTGVAAQLIDGRTAHSFLGMRFPMSDMEREAAEKNGRQWILSQAKTPVQRIQRCRMLIIDEISMANVEFMQLMIERFRTAFMRPADWPKVVLVGDFLQLPPAGGERIFMSEAWQSKVWVIRLSQQHRQADPEFLSALNDVRVGKVSDKTRKLFESRIVPELPSDCVHLHSHNVEVDNKNNARLAELPGDPIQFNWKITVNDKIDPEEDVVRVEEAIERAKKQSRLSEAIFLKPDSRVLLLNNDQEGRWVNGSTGTIQKIDPELIKIKLDRGGVVDAERFEEDLLDGTVSIGKISQFPLRLAWAMTIHKAQGMTLDRVGIDLADHFSTGQTYVALSRCKYLETLHLVGKLPDVVMADQQAMAYCEAEHPPPSHWVQPPPAKLEPGGLIIDEHVLMRAIPKKAPNKVVCALLGVPFPLKAGWRERVLGKVLSPAQAAKLEEYIRRIGKGETFNGFAGEVFLASPLRKSDQPSLFKIE